MKTLNYENEQGTATSNEQSCKTSRIPYGPPTTEVISIPSLDFLLIGQSSQNNHNGQNKAPFNCLELRDADELFSKDSYENASGKGFWD